MTLAPAPGKRKCNCRQRVVTRQIGPGMYQQYTEDECDECDAVKLVREASEVEVTVEPGTRPGHEVRFFEEGEPEVDGDPGDLVFVVRQAGHPRFARVDGVEEARLRSSGKRAGGGGGEEGKRKQKKKNKRQQIPGMPQNDDDDERTAIPESGGDDLALEVSIPLVDALVGFSTKIKHLDGHAVPIATKGVTRPGDVVTLVGEGMPRAPARESGDGDDDDEEEQQQQRNKKKGDGKNNKKGSRGDLHVTFTIDFPGSLTEKQKSVVREHFKAPPRDEL
jgi:DnaJ family protein B protein 11